MTPLFADKAVLDRRALNSSDIQLADLYSLGLIAYNLFTGKNFWEGVTTQDQLHEAHSNSEKRLRANLQVSNDSECYDFISRLLRISSPFANIKEVLEHSFLSSKHVIVIPNLPNQYRINKSDPQIIQSFFQEIENKFSIPVSSQILVSPEGDQVSPGSNFPFVTFLFSLRKEDYKPLLHSMKPISVECK